PFRPRICSYVQVHDGHHNFPSWVVFLLHGPPPSRTWLAESLPTPLPVKNQEPITRVPASGVGQAPANFSAAEDLRNQRRRPRARPCEAPAAISYLKLPPGFRPAGIKKKAPVMHSECTQGLP